MKKPKNHITPPRLAEKLLLWFLKDELTEEVLGDLDEKFYSTLNQHSKRKAKRNYWFQVINYLRPFAFKFFKTPRNIGANNNAMFKHNFKVSYRQMLKNKGYSFINIGGLAMGMVVAMLVSLWVQDELSFNSYHSNTDQIIQIFRQGNENNERVTNEFLTTGMGSLLRESFPDKLEQVVMKKSRSQTVVLSNEKKKFTVEGNFWEADGPDLFSLKMISGNINGLKDLKTILLSEYVAKNFFGNINPVGEFIKIDAGVEVMVTGVYQDFPNNSTFAKVQFIAPLPLLFGGNNESLNVWNNYNIYIFAKVNKQTDLDELSKSINQLLLPRLGENAKNHEMAFVLLPMSHWHTKQFENGNLVNSQAYKFIWLYGLIGLFVLILACINFMNLSTARSEKRAKEVGIRKTFGSLRKQLIAQFYIESFLYTISAFVLSLILLWSLLPWFNITSGKTLVAPWLVIDFWLICIVFILLTTLIAGSYPAAYLSGFKPIKALRGGHAAGKSASLPRKALVVFQFVISISLIISTITVNNQIQHAKNREIGYSPMGMIALRPASPNFGKNKELLKQEIMNTGMAQAVGYSNYSVISNLGWNDSFSWEGMDPAYNESFNTISISNGYADAVGLEFIAGRDFDPNLQTDKNAIIINESALKEMNLENPIGTVVRYDPTWREAKNYTIIGVVKDMIKGSPFQQTDQSIMFLDEEYTSYMYVRLNPDVSASQALSTIEKVYKEILPEAPFDFHFADDDYNRKFDAELRIGKLASFFTLLAILISCLGLFGLSAFVAEQRTKEIGIRKVLGASAVNLWQLLSKDFTLLVLISCFIAIPVAYHVLQGWLDGYEVKTQLYWWVFAIAGAGALLVTLITVSFQAIKAAMANPVKSLRSE